MVKPLRIVADLGNSRLKWASLDDEGRLGPSIAVPVDAPETWRSVWDDWNKGDASPSLWAVSSVNPPVAALLEAFLDALPCERVEWIRSATVLGLRTEIERIETAGADRGLAVLAALRLPRVKPGQLHLLVLCGSAITVERISAEGIWEGGAITLGLGMTAKALHSSTAMLPMIHTPSEPPNFGRLTVTAMQAGIYWGVVGAVRELLLRQGSPEEIGTIHWTGGDADALSKSVAMPGSVVVPDLVLQGLAIHSFGSQTP